MAENIEIYSPGMKLLARDLYEVADGIAVEVRAELSDSAEEIRKAAAANALSYESTSRSTELTGSGGTREQVANSIRVVRKGGEEVRIEAGGADVPLAGLWELGNRDSNPNSSTFRHPVYGKKSTSWQTQMKWPYLRRAIDEYEPVLLTRFQAVVNRLFRRHRL